MNFKTKEISVKAMSHLLSIGCTTNHPVKELEDSPYLLINKGVIKPCFSVKEYRDFEYSEKQENKILKIQKELPLKEKKKLTHREKAAYQLVKLLNNSKNSKITGYDVSWTIQPQKREYPKQPQPSLVKPLTPEQLKELGIHINVDVTDCKNYKEASMVQDLILNKKVKINIFQNNKIK